LLHRLPPLCMERGDFRGDPTNLRSWDCASMGNCLMMAERVGFEPTWLAPIRFRGGAVMTASVPLLISKWHFSNKTRPCAVANKTQADKLNQGNDLGAFLDQIDVGPSSCKGCRNKKPGKPGLLNNLEANQILY
jgi:hypothetical protein